MPGLYIGSTSGYSGKNTITVGLGMALKQAGLAIGYMKPVGAMPVDTDQGLADEDALFVRDALGQLAIVLVVATALGVAVALGLGALVGDGVPFSLRPAPIAASTVALIVLGMAGSLVALRRIGAVDPIVALGSDS